MQTNIKLPEWANCKNEDWDVCRGCVHFEECELKSKNREGSILNLAFLIIIPAVMVAVVLLVLSLLGVI